jgi:hypothetical protein
MNAKITSGNEGKKKIIIELSEDTKASERQQSFQKVFKGRRWRSNIDTYNSKKTKP